MLYNSHKGLAKMAFPSPLVQLPSSQLFATMSDSVIFLTGKTVVVIGGSSGNELLYKHLARRHTNYNVVKELDLPSPMQPYSTGLL